VKSPVLLAGLALDASPGTGRPVSMTNSAKTSARLPSHSSVVLEFLGSMNLAITLLVAIAVASVIGTVLQQNQPYQDYIIKFGPFWFDVFQRLALFDVYGASWFLLILSFLVISTGVCVYRNTPHMLRDMRNFRQNVERKSLQAFHLRKMWQVEEQATELRQALAAWLTAQGYRFRVSEGDAHILLAGMKGSVSKLGYFFTHGAIVVICLGALFDSSLPLMLREASGKLLPETRDIPASQVPEISRLPVNNPSFRGSVRIPEGSSANVVFLQLRDGYLVQPLPFSIEVKDFRIEHYATGQPKSFESDIVIHDTELKEPLQRTIAVNHPLIYSGYAIYQASFSDGGTGLTLNAWPLRSPEVDPHRVEGTVQKSIGVETARGPMTLEFTDFRMFNINPVVGEDGREQQKNFGPSFTYRLRDAQGQAREYETYMAPVVFDGRQYFLSGVRESAAEPFRYLHIPVDAEGSIKRFQRFNALLYDEPRVLEAARRTTEQSFGQTQLDQQAMREEVVASMVRLVSRYRHGGFDAVAAMVEQTVPEDRREEVFNTYVKVLQTILGELYVELLGAEGVDIAAGIKDDDALFFDEALTAVGALEAYGSPFYLQLTAFDFVQASGLQIARAPGKNVVYFGFALLTAGVFLMFYVPNRRIWFWIDREDGVSRVLAAGTGHRHQHDFEQEFQQLCGQLDQRWKAVDD